jgi:hypothetical protein
MNPELGSPQDQPLIRFSRAEVTSGWRISASALYPIKIGARKQAGFAQVLD